MASKVEKDEKNNRVRVLLGTGTWGPNGQTKKEVASKQLKTLIDNPLARVKSGPEQGKIMVDTARMYHSGESEKMLGALLRENPSWRSQISIHTKATPTITPFTREGLFSQLNASLGALDVDKVDIYYLHWPDINTPIEETLSALNELHKAKKFIEFGLSNYASWDVVRIYWLCKAKGWMVPTVYQGMYNAITRNMEAELMPALRTCGIRSYWYNPLAGGFLTGKYANVDEKPTEGRFSPQMGPFLYAAYQQRYWKKEFFDSLEVIRKVCDTEQITTADAALRWCMHHSVLRGNQYDGVLFGASSLLNLEANLKSLSGDKLPKTIVEAFDHAWLVAAPESEPYFRGYGTKSGRSEQFLAKF